MVWLLREVIVIRGGECCWCWCGQLAAGLLRSLHVVPANRAVSHCVTHCVASRTIPYTTLVKQVTSEEERVQSHLDRAAV